jgi:hypothetical protein
VESVPHCRKSGTPVPLEATAVDRFKIEPFLRFE